MAKTKDVESDLLGIAAFVSAVGNLVQADNQNKLQALYRNLFARYRYVCKEYQALSSYNQQLKQEVLNLRARNDQLQKQIAIK